MDLIILAAGKGSRMQSSIPKALHKTINNMTNIENTILKCNVLFDNIFIVINDKDINIFKESLNKEHHPKLLSISSGLGSGHAIYELISNYNSKISKEFVIVWGDAVIYNDNIINELVQYNNSMCFPVIMNNNPYVSINVDDNFYAKYVDFSKYGEMNKVGFQDKCIFKVNKQILFKALQSFHFSCFKSGRYITESGEFEFLYIIHLLYQLKKKIKCYITDYENDILSYNTKDELEKLLK